MRPKKSGSSRRGFFDGLSSGLGMRPAPQPAGASANSAPISAEPPPRNPVIEPLGTSVVHHWWAASGSTVPRPDYGATRYQGSGRLIGRKALVTGGDSGMGRAAAIAFAREGADVAFNYPPSEQSHAHEVVGLIRQAGGKAVALPGELRDEAFCKRLVADAVRELGGLDVLVSNAAKQHAVADIADMSTDQFDATFRTNIYAMFWLTKAALPHLGPGASIINTSSVNAYDPSQILLDYSATKGAITVFTKSLAKQLAGRGIRVNAVAPGPMWTPHPDDDEQVPEDKAGIGADLCVPRPDRPAELASIYVLLASQESSYATGQLYGAVG